MLVCVLEIPFFKQNLCHLAQKEAYLFLVLCLQDERLISLVNSGIYKHPNAAQRLAEQPETFFPARDEYPWVLWQPKSLFGDCYHFLCDTHHIGVPTLGDPFGNTCDPRSSILYTLCNCASYDAKRRKSIEFDICP